MDLPATSSSASRRSARAERRSAIESVAPAPTGDITIVLRGEPAGKGRPRFRIVTPKDKRKPPFVHVYTPKETVDYEAALKLAGRVAMGRRQALTGPLKVTVTAVMPVPVSWSRKKRDAALAGSLWPVVTPDWDNIAKMLDGLNEIVWLDDKQIVDGRCIKRYGESPMLEVKVSEISAGLFGEQG